MMKPVPRSVPPKDASLAAAVEAMQANRPLRAEEICRAYLEMQPRLRRAPAPARQCAEQAGPVRRVRTDGASRDRAASRIFPTCTRTSAACWRCSSGSRKPCPCFEQAIRLEPRLPLAHKKLGQALAALGRGQDADAAFEEFFELDSARGQVALALDHLRAGRKTEAIDTLRGALRENASNVDAMRFLAQIYWREEKQQSDAEALLRRATTLAPGFTAAWLLLGAMLHEVDRHAESIECYQAATRPSPTTPSPGPGSATATRTSATWTKPSPRSSARWPCIRTSPNVQLSYGHVLKTRGDQPAALRAYRAAIAVRPDFGEVYWSMANLKVFRFEDAEIAAMEQQLERDDLARAPTSIFASRWPRRTKTGATTTVPGTTTTPATSASARRCSTIPVAMELRHEQIATVFTRELFEKHAGQGCDAPAPILIVGLPRSGSTLIEQILASHSQVEGTAELPVLMRLAYSIGRYRPDQKRYPESVVDLRGKDFKAYGRQYMDETRAVPRHRPAVLHRQAAEQLLARRPAAPDPAERPRHQRPPASVRQLPRRLQAAVRQGAELHLRHGRPLGLLPPVLRDDAALAPGAAGQGARRALRGNGDRPGNAGAPHPRRTAACRSRRRACASTRTAAR